MKRLIPFIASLALFPFIGCYTQLLIEETQHVDAESTAEEPLYHPPHDPAYCLPPCDRPYVPPPYYPRPANVIIQRPAPADNPIPPHRTSGPQRTPPEDQTGSSKRDGPERGPRR